MKKKIRSIPEFCYFTDNDRNAMDLYVSIPGVDVNTIRVKSNAHNICFTASAQYVNYGACVAFGLPVTKKVTSEYECGLLKINVPLEGPMSRVAVTATL